MTPSEKDKDFTSIYAGTRWVGGVMDLTYQETEAKVSFRMPSFRPFVLMQETYANLPFQSWELRALSDNSALFSISGALLHLSITVQVGDGLSTPLT